MNWEELVVTVDGGGVGVGVIIVPEPEREMPQILYVELPAAQYPPPSKMCLFAVGA